MFLTVQLFQSELLDAIANLIAVDSQELAGGVSAGSGAAALWLAPGALRPFNHCRRRGAACGTALPCRTSPWRFAGERIPTLAEALRAGRGKGPLLLDVPVIGLGAAIAETFRAVGLPLSMARVATWDDEQRRGIAAHMPGATIIQADGPPNDVDAGDVAAQRAAGVRGFDVGSWPPGFVQQARTAGMPVWVWTINDLRTMREVIRLGVDAFETDVPRDAIALLVMRCSPSTMRLRCAPTHDRLMEIPIRLETHPELR